MDKPKVKEVYTLRSKGVGHSFRGHVTITGVGHIGSERKVIFKTRIHGDTWYCWDDYQADLIEGIE